MTCNSNDAIQIDLSVDILYVAEQSEACSPPRLPATRGKTAREAVCFARGSFIRKQASEGSDSFVVDLPRPTHNVTHTHTHGSCVL
jgi:uncharacterized protein (UPF0303 family)